MSKQRNLFTAKQTKKLYSSLAIGWLVGWRKKTITKPKLVFQKKTENLWRSNKTEKKLETKIEKKI